ncbi:solute carrier family 35 related protein [Nitzschia inconspicua]|uniref:Solute carrier family 35 related protein n=1 Tax=Nitzschia inconspicua TaxID=303405 RepID=A0A9K3KEX5_9STRA|nr:solute carrier family 35 related protein [Nitzschia inconspicua]
MLGASSDAGATPNQHQFKESTEELVEERIPLANSQGRQQARSFWKDLERRRDGHAPIPPRKAQLSLMFGQLVALVATSMNAASFTLEYGLNKVFPMFLMFWSYLVLSFHLYWSSRSETCIRGALSAPDNSVSYSLFCLKLRAPWWYYLCLSILDVCPNYLALLAMNRTSLTSATLLGSLTIPSTMFFCTLLLRKIYRPFHFVGVSLCMMGGAVTILMDKDTKAEDAAHPDSFYGDILCILAAFGYGIGDAAAEFCSKHIDRVEYVGMIGLFGMMWCLIIFPIFEWEQVVDLFTDVDTFVEAVGIIFWYITSLTGYYVFESLFLKKSDATLLNISLQTSNFWAILFSVVAFQEKPEPQFYLAVSLVTGGVACYELCGNASSSTAFNPVERRQDGLACIRQNYQPIE